MKYIFSKFIKQVKLKGNDLSKRASFSVSVP